MFTILLKTLLAIVIVFATMLALVFLKPASSAVSARDDANSGDAAIAPTSASIAEPEPKLSKKAKKALTRANTARDDVDSGDAAPAPTPANTSRARKVLADAARSDPAPADPAPADKSLKVVLPLDRKTKSAKKSGGSALTRAAISNAFFVGASDSTGNGASNGVDESASVAFPKERKVVDRTNPLIIRLAGYFFQSLNLMSNEDKHNSSILTLLDAMELIKNKMSYICIEEGHPLYGKRLLNFRYRDVLMETYHTCRIFFKDIMLSEMVHMYLNQRSNLKYSGFIREYRHQLKTGEIQLIALLNIFYLDEIVILINEKMRLYFEMNNWYSRYMNGEIVLAIPSETEYDSFASDVCDRMTEWLSRGDEGLVLSFCNFIMNLAHDHLKAENSADANRDIIRDGLDDAYNNHPEIFNEFLLAWTIVVIMEGKMPVTQHFEYVTEHSECVDENYQYMPIPLSSDDLEFMSEFDLEFISKLNDPDQDAIETEIKRLTPIDFSEYVDDPSAYSDTEDDDFSDAELGELDEYYQCIYAKIEEQSCSSSSQEL